MGQLEHVMRAIQAKKNGGAVPDYMESIGSLNALIHSLGRPGVSDERFQEGLSALSSGLSDLGVQLKALHSALVGEMDKRSTSSVASISSEVKRLGRTMMELTSALQKIEIKPPEVSVAAPDLSVIIDEIRALKREEPEEVEEEESPKEWVFEVRRNQAGFIRSVEAKAK